MHLLEKQVPDEGIELGQVQRIVVDTPLVLVLVQELGRCGTKRAIGSCAVELRRTNLVDSFS